MEPVEILRQYVEHLAVNGVPADLNPTLGGRLGDGTDPIAWQQYMRDFDQLLRMQARRILEEYDGVVRDQNTAKAALDRLRAKESTGQSSPDPMRDVDWECKHLFNSNGRCQKNCGYSL